MEFFNSFFSDSKSHDENAIWKKHADIASANNRALLIVQEPWSSGYGRRLMYWRPWVRIPALYNGWTFFKSICRKNCIDACLKIKRGRRWPILKQFSSHPFWRWDTSRCPCKPFRRWRRLDEPSDLNGTRFLERSHSKIDRVNAGSHQSNSVDQNLWITIDWSRQNHRSLRSVHTTAYYAT